LIGKRHSAGGRHRERGRLTDIHRLAHGLLSDLRRTGRPAATTREKD
jgi:hypothetical protein